MTILVVWPAPTGPMWVQLPRSASTGRALATSASAPPAMIASVPAAAAGGPPETGASTQPMPASVRSRSANALVASTAVVEWSTSSLPGAPPAAMPSAPNTAAARSSLVITQTCT